MVLALLGFVFTACSDEEPTKETPIVSAAKLTLTSESSVSYNATGGNYSILYTLENPDGKTKVEARCDADWITDINAQTSGRIFYTVAPNYAEARDTKIYVTYGDQGFSVSVSQQKGEPKKYDVEWVAPNLEGIYYGTLYSSTYNYSLVFTDNGMTAEGAFLANSTYYLVDIYSNNAPTNTDKIQAPVGTYNFDSKDTMANGTISNEYSGYVVTNDSSYDANSYFSEATLTITESGLELVATIEGKIHHVTFSGDYSLADATADPGYYYSTLEDNVALSFSENTVCEVSYWGDYYTCGYANYELYLVSDLGHNIQLEFFSSDATFESGFEGTYNVAGDSYAPMIYVPGYIYEYEGQSVPLGCWFLNVGTEGLTDIAPLGGGTITIAKATENGKEIYTVTFDCVDDNPESAHTIKGSWTGEITLVDETVQSASVRSKAQRGTGITYNKKEIMHNRF